MSSNDVATGAASVVTDKDKFTDLTGIVIDNFEGGYYHPDMLPSFKPSDQEKLKASGETMFGLDRKAGNQLAKYPEWAIFWHRVDMVERPLKYNSRGGDAEPELKRLCAAIMFQWYNELAKKYLTPDSLQAIANDDRLTIHLSYACWNGEGWFKRFAQALKDGIANHPNDKDGIYAQAFMARISAFNKDGSVNKVIRQQGTNMITLFKKMGLV